MNYLAIPVLAYVVVTQAYIHVGPKLGDNRVVGGRPATADEAPWQISLVKQSLLTSGHICGGSLIGTKTVLTAAHCCDGQLAAALTVKYGGLDRTKLATSNPVTKVTMHPNWNKDTIDSDYCLLSLRNAVQTGNNVEIIPIASSKAASGTKANLTGWGKTSGSTNTLPVQLQYGQFDIVTNEDCKQKWQGVNNVTDNMICASSKTVSGCNGDSGGPLVINKELVGVVSWGANGCPADTTNNPTVYADASAGRTWVNEQMAKQT